MPRHRKALIDALHVGVRRHIVHAFVELDVTLPKQRIREHLLHEGERISFTAFVIHCVARALEEHHELHSYRDWRGRRVSFDDVDILVQIESEIDWVAAPHVIRNANHRSVREIQEEIRRLRHEPGKKRLRSGMLARVSGYGPGVVRRSFFHVLRRNPRHLQRTCGTALVTAIGIFGGVYGWSEGIVPLHTLAVEVGGLATKPGLVDGRVQPREYMALTIAVDHAVVDGAPSARFVRTLASLIEDANGLPTPMQRDMAH